ncbi:MAG: hypothetical protein ACFCGT_02240 [Sandaracinaceae bacterium]
MARSSTASSCASPRRRHRRSPLAHGAWAAALGLGLAAGTATGHAQAPHAQASPSDAAALYGQARAAERALDLAAAAEAYRAVLEAAPSSRLGRVARRRLAYLTARSAGGYAPLATTLAFAQERRTPSEVEGFEAAVAAFPAGLVRREARVLLGEAWLAAGDGARAAAAYRALLQEPDVADTERATARAGVARAMAIQGAPGRGAALLAEEGMAGTPTHRSLRRAARRRWGRPIAWALLVGFTALCVAAGRRDLVSAAALRRAFAPLRVGLVALLLAFPVWLAQRYEPAAAVPFALVAAGSAALLALSAWTSAALHARRAPKGWRWALGTAAVAAHGALGYLALEAAPHLFGFA